MLICETANRGENLITELTGVWERSVKATHLFLSGAEVAQIKTYVPQAMADVEHLLTCCVEGTPVAFMGIEKNRIEMLFIEPQERGKGYGRQLVEYAFAKFKVDEVCVNEQNPEAKIFYERMGFAVYKRTPLDEQGQPYPLLYMRRAL